MPRYSKLPEQQVYRDMTDVFLGCRRQMKIRDGEFYDTKNLTSAQYPLLAERNRRGLVARLEAPGGLAEKDALAYIEGGTLYYNSLPTGLEGLSPGEKQLVSMGAYLCVFPDKMYFNTADFTDYGSMEARYEAAGSISYALCRADGQEYGDPALGAEPPEEPENGALWIDQSGENESLKQWNEINEMWVSVPTVYTKISFTTQGQIPALFSRWDGVKIEGAADEKLNGDKIIYALGGEEGKTSDYIVVVGLLQSSRTDEEGKLSIKRELPELDYVCECQNRLWGCYYGNDGEKNINEIYCCALGDFKNWRQYLGLSTDSWAASVGSDGQWTGAVNYLGHPCFFKENRIHRVSVSSAGAHQLSETVCRGVQKGSAKSLAVVNETLYYKSRQDVCAWQGGFPQSVSGALGDELYSEAAAGAVGERYYISMKDRRGGWNLFVYDIARGLWMHEDELHVRCFARVDDELYCVDGENRLLCLTGGAGELEEEIDWMAETGMLYYSYPDRKYVSRFNLRLQMESGGELKIYIQYDSDGQWRGSGSIVFSGTNTVTVPVRPRRCDHMRIRLCGRGRIRLFSIAKILEIGSDV